MVGISITSAPISRSGLARPPDCLLARVVKMRQPQSGSSCLADLAAFLRLTMAFFVPVADLFALMAASAPQLPARTRRSEFCPRRAPAALVLFRGPVSRHLFLPPVHAGSRFHPAAPP